MVEAGEVAVNLPCFMPRARYLSASLDGTTPIGGSRARRDPIFPSTPCTPRLVPSLSLRQRSLNSVSARQLLQWYSEVWDDEQS